MPAVIAQADSKESEADSPNPPAIRPLAELNVDIAVPEGVVPRDRVNLRTGLSDAKVSLRQWPKLEYHWAASSSRSFPLYFEEVNAERYGYACRPCLQPAVSAVHFFGTIPYMPYLMAANCPRECVYTLGHYRPGSCSPWRAHSFPYRADAAGVETAAIWALVFMLP